MNILFGLGKKNKTWYLVDKKKWQSVEKKIKILNNIL